MHIHLMVLLPWQQVGNCGGSYQVWQRYSVHGGHYRCELVAMGTVPHARSSVGPLLQRWMSEMDTVARAERLLQLLANLVRHNSAYLDQHVLAGLVQ